MKELKDYLHLYKECDCRVYEEDMIDFTIIDKGLAIRKWDKYRCDMCNDSGAVTTGISEDGHIIYSTCPCVDDERN